MRVFGFSRHFSFAFLSCLALTACANGAFVKSPMLDMALEASGLVPKAAQPSAPAAQEVLGPPLIIGLGKNRVAMPFVAEQGSIKQYASPDGVAVAMNNGFVSRTSGIGLDLEGQFLEADGLYMNGFVQKARAGETGQRIIEVWNKGSIQSTIFTCRFTTSKTEAGRETIDEYCSAFHEGSFENRYWLEDDTVICSRQTFRPDAPPIQLFSTETQAVTLDLTEGDC